VTEERRLRRTHTLALSGDYMGHEGAEKPSTEDKALQRVGSLASPAFGQIDVRIPTYPLGGSLPQAVMDEMCLHPQVALATELKTNVIVGQDFRFLHDDPRAAAICDAVWRPHHRAYVRNSVRTGIHYGFCLFESVWNEEASDIHITYTPDTGTTVVGGKDETQTPDEPGEETYAAAIEEDVPSRLIAKLKPIQPSNVLGMVIDGVENFCGAKIISPPNAVLRVEEGACVLFTHNARWANFFGEAELRRAYEAWFWQKQVVLQMVRFTARLASPPPVIKFPAGKSPDGRTNQSIAEGMAQSLVSGDLPIIVLPKSDDPNAPQWEVDFIQLQTEGAIKGYLAVIEYFNAQILRSLLMPDSVATTQGLSANRSIGEVHEDSFFAACDGYIEELVTPIEKQVGPLIALYNFGPDMAAPRVEIPPLDNDRKETIRQVIVNAARTGNLPINWTSITELAGIPIDKAKASAQETKGDTTAQAAPTNPDAGTATIEAEAKLRDDALALEEAVHTVKLALMSMGSVA